MLSGTLYSDEGITEYTSATSTIKVSVNSSTTYATTTVSGSADWVIDGVDFSTSSVLTVWVDGEPTFRASLVTKVASTTDISGLDLYKDYLIVQSEGGTGLPITNSILGNYDSDDDSNIQFTANNGVLVQSVGQSLFIADDTTYSPEGNDSWWFFNCYQYSCD
ncbi:MAG: hypothetical protein R3B60_03240 [Candidatus Paceibacterota bacterium]